MAQTIAKIEVQNINSPQHVVRVDAAKYTAMREALLAVLPDTGPGMTPADAIAALKPHLPQGLFPGGDKAGWWMKCAQLDLEAKGLITRAAKPPVRLYRLPAGSAPQGGVRPADPAP